VFGNQDSTSYRGHTRPFAFPQLGYPRTVIDGYLPCRLADCSRCAASPEFIPVHYDCLEIFRQRCSAPDALRRLWVLAAWRSPWRRARPVHFSCPMVGKPTLSMISQFCGLPLLHTLPQELLEIIRSHSQHSLLWRCIPVLKLARHTSATAPEPLITLPFHELHSWERNGRLQRVTTSQSPLPILRFTVDSGGISKVERLPDRPQYQGECTTRSAFIVEQDDPDSKVLAQLQDGRLRLVFLDRPSFQLWNTPAPPSFTLCRACPAEIARCQTFYAVEMDEIDGITFFFSLSRLCGLHIHHRGESCALDSCTRAFSNQQRRGVVWIYLPVSKRDSPLLLGVREEVQITRIQSIVVRTKLVGDVFVGMQCTGAVQDYSLGSSAPLTMIYGEPKQPYPVYFFGAFCRVPDKGPTKPFCLPSPHGSPMGATMAYFSWAPLSDVSSTLVFYDESNGACKGILLHYRNGGARAVGQCRLQVDPTEKVAQPVRVCIRVDSCSRPNREDLHIARVRFEQTPQGRTTVVDEGWESHQMAGIIKFWFTSESCFIVVED
ncbi:uncharacterized protein THITE_2054246, partial [Thermothielavioides terrestris NRRL 8126]